jgi:hypothetical protein
MNPGNIADFHAFVANSECSIRVKIPASVPPDQPLGGEYEWLFETRLY